MLVLPTFRPNLLHIYLLPGHTPLWGTQTIGLWSMQADKPSVIKMWNFTESLIYFFLAFFLNCPRRRQWHPTPVLLPGKSPGQRSLVGCSPWGLKELDTTERLHFHFSLSCTGEGNGHPLPMFLPRESQGRRSLVGCRLWGCTESDNNWSDLAAAAAAGFKQNPMIRTTSHVFKVLPESMLLPLLFPSIFFIAIITSGDVICLYT